LKKARRPRKNKIQYISKIFQKNFKNISRISRSSKKIQELQEVQKKLEKKKEGYKPLTWSLGPLPFVPGLSPGT
jgi:hypothetical protein